MNFNRKTILIFISLIIISSTLILLFWTRSGSVSTRTESEDKTVITASTTTSTPSPSLEKSITTSPTISITTTPIKTVTPAVTKQPSPSAQQAKGIYDQYSSSAVAKGGKIVLFFYSSDSPSSIDLDMHIKANSSLIPAEVTILRVDFKIEDKLKEKYIVNYDHTLVQIDSKGNMIKKWSGSPTIQELLIVMQ